MPCHGNHQPATSQAKQHAMKLIVHTPGMHTTWEPCMACQNTKY